MRCATDILGSDLDSESLSSKSTFLGEILATISPRSRQARPFMFDIYDDLAIKMVTYLHCNPLQDCILLNKLDVINRQTHEKVHDDDGHGDDEDDEQGLGGVHVGDSDQVLVIELVVKEQVVILHLPACHDEGLDDGKHQVAEILLVVQQHKEAETEGENEKQNNH